MSELAPEQKVSEALSQCEYWIEHECENLTYAQQEAVFIRLIASCEKFAAHAHKMKEACSE